MHEMSLVANLLSVAEQALSDYRVKRVNAIEVSISRLAGVMQDAFQFAFDTLTENTVFENAELNTVNIPLTIECDSCGASYESDDFEFICPSCGSARGKIASSDEVYLTGIDFEEMAE